MERRVELGWLSDFYGPLLTERQRTVLQMYCEDDMTLQEIAQALEISRQGAHEIVRAAEGQLQGYEQALGLMRRYRAMTNEVAACRDILRSIAGRDENDREALKKALEALERIMSIER